MSQNLAGEVAAHAGAIAAEELDGAVGAASRALSAEQKADGHFLFELEADATIPAEYVLFTHWRGESADGELERKIGNYLRRIQGVHGGWPLFHGGRLNVSASVKAYFALKMIGDDARAPHMVRARDAILAHGGAAESNVFTRTLLALYGVIPWRGVPVMPVEIMLLPRWFPFHIAKISYWARTVLVPLTVLYALRPTAKNPRRVGIPELFCTPPERIGRWPRGPHQHFPWSQIFSGIDRLLRRIEPYFPAGPRRRAIDQAAKFTIARLNGEDGIGAIFPAMVNSVMMLDALGYRQDHPELVTARAAIDKLLAIGPDEAYCQPCLSPVWDTALMTHVLLEVGGEDARRRARCALEWLRPRQVLDKAGDWAMTRPNVRPGGWAFQYANPSYPDLDDTAVVVMAMDRAMDRAMDGPPDRAADEAASHAPARDDFREAIARAREWIVGLQSGNGGFAAFDADNSYEYLNHIPFSDHGALLDPPTADVTARCVSMFAQLGETPWQSAPLRRALDFLRRVQEPDGSWYGRWGMNYIYGTWSALCALNAAGVEQKAPEVRRAIAWLATTQNSDGGWGEDGESYKVDYRGHEPAESTASQTAWALLALMAAGERDHPAVERGVRYLLATQGGDGLWRESRFTATGFPRVFYLRYHGYAKFFPLWALARYRNLMRGNAMSALVGM
jgi:squalene-hopene/tetraprenyl-beta-curcumene cyclase